MKYAACFLFLVIFFQAEGKKANSREPRFYAKRKEIKHTNKDMENKIFSKENLRKHQPTLDFNPVGKIPQKPFQPNLAKALIIGGARVMRKQMPWAVLLNIDGIILCGGSVISANHILTAAHCIFGFTKFIVNVGGVDRWTRESGEMTVGVKTAIFHDSYDEANIWYDIGILTLSRTLALDTFVNVIRLPKVSDASRTFSNVSTIVAGYGQTADNSSTSRYLMFATLTVTSNVRCEAFYGYGSIISSIMCTAADRARSICSGDSGSGMLTKEDDGYCTIIGITSFGSSRSCLNTPAGFTRVTSFLGWISNITNIYIRK